MIFQDLVVILSICHCLILTEKHYSQMEGMFSSILMMIRCMLVQEVHVFRKKQLHMMVKASFLHFFLVVRVLLKSRP
ncbi:Uncharacterised protein [Klebsiella pneumoniae]|nr:Uncharacterised protein [Klebsiella pneumoniae]